MTGRSRASHGQHQRPRLTAQSQSWTPCHFRQHPTPLPHGNRSARPMWGQPSPRPPRGPALIIALPWGSCYLAAEQVPLLLRAVPVGRLGPFALELVESQSQNSCFTPPGPGARDSDPLLPASWEREAETSRTTLLPLLREPSASRAKRGRKAVSPFQLLAGSRSHGPAPSGCRDELSTLSAQRRLHSTGGAGCHVPGSSPYRLHPGEALRPFG